MSDTFGRIADDELASLIARAAGEEEGGKRPHTWGLIRSALLELEQYRARIAAHAAAHPERLSDGDLEEVRTLIAKRGECAGPLTTFPKPGIAHVAIVCRDNWDDVIRWLAACVEHMDTMALELQQRRAADLTPKEIAFAKEWLRDLEDFAHMEAPEAQIPISIFRKLLAAHGVTP